MKHNFAIVRDKSTTVPLGYIPVPLTDTGSIINLSCDNIICDCLEYYTKKQSTDSIQQLLEKIKPSGLLVIILTDIKKQLSGYINGSTPSDKLLQTFVDKLSIWSLDDILLAVNKPYLKIQKIDHVNNQIIITIKRISLD
jgi:hypothetical protein